MLKFNVEMVDNTHSVIVSDGAQERLYFKSGHGLHTACAVHQTVMRDIAHHGDSVVEFDALPLVATRINARGRRVRYAVI